MDVPAPPVFEVLFLDVDSDGSGPLLSAIGDAPAVRSVSTVETVQQARDRMRNTERSCVLCGRPEYGQRDAIERLTTHERPPPVIALRDPDDDQSALLEAGATDVATWQMSPEPVVRRLENAVSRHALGDSSADVSGESGASDPGQASRGESLQANDWLTSSQSENTGVAAELLGERITHLHDVAMDLQTYSSRPRIYDRTVEAARQILGFEWATVAVVEDGAFEIVATSESSHVERGERPLSAEEGVVGRVYETGESRVIDRVADEDEAKPVSSDIASAIAVRVEDIGVFQAGSETPGTFDRYDLELAELLVSHTTESLRRVNQQERIRQREREYALLKQLLARIMRHNVRNDLTAIRAFASTLETNLSGNDADLAAAVVDRAEHLIDTSDKAGDIERVIERDADPGPIDVSTAVRDAVSDVRREYEDADVVLGTPDGVRAVASVDLELAVRNLVENACEHADVDEPRVEVTVEPGDRIVTITVADDGPGIPEDEIAVIRDGTETPLQHGSGAGLWLVDRVVRASDGDLEFESAAQETTVTVRLTAPGVDLG